MNRLLIAIFVMTLVCPSALYGQGENSQKKFNIVIDPGHGGKDPGALDVDDKSVEEKDIILSVSVKLKEMIADQIPNVSVTMTREKDVFIPLVERAKIANKAKSDIFISIHVNSLRPKDHPKYRSVKGIRFYVMGIDSKDEQGSMTALRENASILFEDDYQTTYAEYNSDTPEGKIALKLMQLNTSGQSWRLAETMEKYARRELPKASSEKMINSGNIYILRGTTMPSVLVELGFITNAEESKLMQSSSYQTQLAQIIVDAIKDYKNSVENNSSSISVVTPTETKPEIKPDTTERPKFYIQVASGLTKLPVTDRSFKSYAGKVVIKHIGNRYKYFVGETEDYDKVIEMLPEVRRQFSDAFVVAFKGDKQISIAEAKQ